MAQSFDGAAVVSSGLNKVEAKVKERAPLASFLHCYAHRLHLVLSQGASKLKECKLFLAHLDGLAAFSSRSPKRSELLKRRLPDVAPSQWQLTSQWVRTVFKEREALIELFRHILSATMTMTRTPCAVLMDFTPVWRTLAFVFFAALV